MGEPFRSFDERWSSFPGREEPLERTFDGLPDDERATVAGGSFRSAARSSTARAARLGDDDLDP
ncbi:MAG: hypothetical protein ICV64_06425 [Thermoleophilia bacterium]|nr:hypothetical protein [Thermoleophilia bacterium]